MTEHGDRTPGKPDPGGCYGSQQVEIVDPGASYEAVWTATGLLILTGLWKTPARISRVFHSPLDGANGCAAHKDQQALLLVSPPERVE